jgi:glutamate formiminotransferase/formiminotetrahydrofolate cyclodeaminase
MGKIVECVPNFSDGRNLKVVNAIASAIHQVQGAKLLGVEPNKDYNRTVVTFVGEPDATKEAAFQATKVAAEMIDMRVHRGEHPRIGAADVVPFVPVAGVTMNDCVRLAHEYGKRVGEELGIPIYLYEYAATKPERKNLATIREGEYEGLSAKIQDPKWQPDYGPAVFNAKSGATVTGARVFLIAYNVNLNTSDKKLAHEIALRIRESGRPKKDEHGKFVLDERGQKVVMPGSLKTIKAMGVLLETHNIAQVSINVTNYEVVPPHVVFEEVKKEAKTLGIEVTGSEIVGVTPKAPLLIAGKYYLEQEGKDTNPDISGEEELIRIAIEKLGLSQLEKFEPEKKIIEYQL